MRVFSIPASAPFLKTLIAALVDGALVPGFDGRDPQQLATATLYLPTRRAGRMARDLFLDGLGTDAVLLPRIVVVGDIDENELGFADAALPASPETLDIPPALGGLPRRLLLAQLIAAWAKTQKPGDATQAPLVLGSPSATLALADDLARLMDDMATRGVGWDALKGLVPEDLDRYWQLTLDFLKIAADVWPAILKEKNAVDSAVHRDLLIAAEARRLAAHAGGPVIAAGSTGSVPSTAKLLRAIAAMPRGAVVLPGLDLHLDDVAWQLIGGSRAADGTSVTPPASNHPQFAMDNLLATLGIARADVVALGALGGRDVLASEAMRPALATSEWQRRLREPDTDAQIAAGMTNLSVVAADTPEMEALAIAVAMRESYEHGQSAALVTPDRALARRVGAALGRWTLPFDDSGGDPLTETPAGIFARLVAEIAANGLEPPTLLALLKHPLFRLGRAQHGWRDAVDTLELAVLRGPRPAAGCAGLAQAFTQFRADHAALHSGGATTLHRSEPRARLGEARLIAAQGLVDALCRALAPFTADAAAMPQPFAQIVDRHAAAVMALATADDGSVPLLAKRDGALLAQAFDDAPTEPDYQLPVALADYPDVFALAFGTTPVRRPQNGEPLLRIYGLLEARLTSPQRVILGGLVEGSWPPSPRIDPWLSRPMRYQLGLDLPERRIGLTAHDFAQALGADDAILTHSAKSGGAPAVASRFLHRLEAVAGRARWDAAVARGARYLACAAALDAPDRVEPAPQPQPRPPRAARPTRLSVTAIEDWLRDPYTIYARYILRLDPLDPVDMALSAADRGSAIHGALGDFTEAFPGALPDDARSELLRFGEARFAPLMERPEARALWWPRFRRIADWFAGWEGERRRGAVVSVIAEKTGEMQLPLADGRVFTLSARADRIERRSDRTFALVDYKTGAPPSNKQVSLGLSPQLTLEAAILRAGGFADVPAGASVSELVYVRLSGNAPAGRECIVDLKRDGQEIIPDEAADAARAALHDHARRFDDPATPYTSLVLPMWSNRYGVYDHLARVREWSLGAGEDEA